MWELTMDFTYQYNYFNLLNCVEMCHNVITLESDKQAIYFIFLSVHLRPTDRRSTIPNMSFSRHL